MKRTFKLNGEVSIEANDILVAYCKKHERSKGYLLEKMIRKFCGGDVEQVAVTEVAAAKAKAPVKRFEQPTWKEVAHYMFDKERVHMDVEANKFCDFYESNGWKVGKNKMKCWKAAVRNWLKGNNNGTQNKANNAGVNKKESDHERIKRENQRKYGQPDECGLAMGKNVGDMGCTVDTGERVESIPRLDNGPFVDY